MAIKVKKITTKAPRASVDAGEVAAPRLSQIRGKGMNAGGSPNDLKKLFPKPKKVSVPKFSKGGKVDKCR